MAKQTFEMTFEGRPLVVEVGQVAKQANGAVVVRYGDTTVLSVAVMSKKMATADFFPLQVNYEEKCMRLVSSQEALASVRDDLRLMPL